MSKRTIIHPAGTVYLACGRKITLLGDCRQIASVQSPEDPQFASSDDEMRRH
jgi:hypothetical protein